MAKDGPNGANKNALLKECRAENARLVKAVASLNDILDSQTEMICRFLPDTTLTYVNRAYASYFQSTPEKLVGTKFLTFVAEHGRKAGLAYLRSFRPDRAFQELQHEAVLPDGTSRWTWWRDHRSAARRVGKECGMTCRSRGSP